MACAAPRAEAQQQRTDWRSATNGAGRGRIAEQFLGDTSVEEALLAAAYCLAK